MYGPFFKKTFKLQEDVTVIVGVGDTQADTLAPPPPWPLTKRFNIGSLFKKMGQSPISIILIEKSVDGVLDSNLGGHMMVVADETTELISFHFT